MYCFSVGQVEYTLLIPTAELLSTTNTVVLKVTGEQGTPVELTQQFQAPSKSTKLDSDTPLIFLSLSQLGVATELRMDR